jgi:hypothetical protein
LWSVLLPPWLRQPQHQPTRELVPTASSSAQRPATRLRQITTAWAGWSLATLGTTRSNRATTKPVTTLTLNLSIQKALAHPLVRVAGTLTGRRCGPPGARRPSSHEGPLLRGPSFIGQHRLRDDDQIARQQHSGLAFAAKLFREVANQARPKSKSSKRCQADQGNARSAISLSTFRRNRPRPVLTM